MASDASGGSQEKAKLEKSSPRMENGTSSSKPTKNENSEVDSDQVMKENESASNPDSFTVENKAVQVKTENSEDTKASDEKSEDVADSGTQGSDGKSGSSGVNDASGNKSVPSAGDNIPSTGPNQNLKRRRTTRSSIAKTSFRPRPLDPYRLLPVMRDESIEFDSTSEAFLLKSKNIKDGTLTHQLINDKKLKETTPSESKEEKEYTAPVKKINIPAPPTRKSDTFSVDVKADYKPTGAYLRQRLNQSNATVEFEVQLRKDISKLKLSSNRSYPAELEYELDIDDLEWLDLRAEKQKSMKEKKSTRSKEASKEDLVIEEDEFEKMIDLMEKATGRNIPISLQQATDIFAKVLGIYKNSNAADSNTIHIGKHGDFIEQVNKAIEDVYNYWIGKRSRLKKPLLRRFWPITATNDSSPHLVFRPREKERYKLRKKRGNDVDSYEKLLQLQCDFNVVHLLLELVRRREKLHQLEINLIHDEFEQGLWDAVKEKSVVQTARPRITKQEKIKGKLSLTSVDIIALLTPAGRQSEMDTSNAENSVKLDRTGIDKKKLKKKRKESDAIDAIWGNKKETDPLQKKKKAESDANTSASKKSEAQPERIPSFLHGVDVVPQYYNTDFLEVCHPIVPTWPGTYVSTSPALKRRSGETMASSNKKSTTKQTDSKSQWVGIAAGVGDPSNYKVKKNQQRKRASSASTYKSASINHNKKAPAVKNGVSFACRARIGRGGRYIIDRIATEYFPESYMSQMSKELYARPHPLEAGLDFIDPVKTRLAAGKKAEWAIKKPTLTTSQITKIQNLYLQEDSEDEDVSVLDHPLLAKPRVEGEDKAKLQASGGGISKDRIPKFSLQLL